MGYRLGLDRIHLRSTPRLGHVEYCDNVAIMEHAFRERHGRKPEVDEARSARVAFNERYAVDMDWVTDDGLIKWEECGRVTDMGHAEYARNGIDKRVPKPCPFRKVGDVYAFDAVAEYGLPEFGEQVAAYGASYRARQTRSDWVCTGGYYKTIVSGAIAAFGWEALLEAAADRRRFESVLETFYQRTLFFNRAWAETSLEVFIQHDDMVWTQGAFMHPDFYRGALFPRYAELWKPLKAAGKRVLFCSDGDLTQFVEDIAAAGADGFIFEPVTSLAKVAGLFGQTHVIVGSEVDCRTLAFGTPEQVQSEVDATLRIAGHCPGFFFAVGNHLPENCTLGNLIFLFDYLMAHWGAGDG